MLRRLQQLLQQQSDPTVRAGQEKYLKYVIKYRGLKTPNTTAVTRQFLKTQEMDAQTSRDLAYGLIESEFAEDKIAGMIVWQEKYLKLSNSSIDWLDELHRIEKLFDDNYVYDWATNDGICSRVLAALIKSQYGPNVEACSRAVAAWSSDSNLWKKRSSLVSFVGMAGKSPEIFPGFRQMLIETLGVVVQSPERFAQTGVGWVVRQLGTADSGALLEFCEANLKYFSREGLRYALEKQPSNVQCRFMDAHKELISAGNSNKTSSSRKKQKT